MKKDDKVILIAFIIGMSLFVCFLFYQSRYDKKHHVLQSIEVVTTSGDTVIISGGDYTEIKLKP